MTHSVNSMADVAGQPAEQPVELAGSLFRKKRFHNHQAPQPMTMMGLSRLLGRYLFARPASLHR